MIVHRVCAAGFAAHIWSGDGGLAANSRWLPAGHRVIYTAENQALAILEYIVHDRLFRESDVVVATAELPDSLAVETVDPKSLDPAWRATDSDRAATCCRPSGLRWVKRKRAPVLRVPSAVSPGEWNYLLQVDHPGFARIAFNKPRRLAIDARLVQNRR